MLLLGSNWYLVDTNWYLTIFTLFRRWLELVFKGAESEDAYDFLVDSHELLHKMGIVERFGVEFVSYQFQGNAKMWWWSQVECQPTEAPPMTWPHSLACLWRSISPGL